MIANYHTHTHRCHHATGTEEDYIERAMHEGLKVLGFSDHAPYIYPEGYVSGYKMTPDELFGYCDTLLALRKKYAGKIDIRIGLEAEYYPELFARTLDFWRSYPLEYLILGQHMVYNEYDKPRIASGAETEDKDRLQRYVELVCEAMKTSRFSYVAHPDLINYVGDIQIYREQMSRLILTAKETETPLEINVHGMKNNRVYPRDDFWALVSDFSAYCVIGSDAHAPENVADKAYYENVRSYTSRFGLKVLDMIELKNPLF